jgi:hypothetical protein
MIARRRQRRCVTPLAGLRVVDLVRSDNKIVETAAADDMNLAVDGGRAGRTARPFHRRQRFPAIAVGIVLEGAGACAFVHRADKSAEGINLVARNRDSEMVAAFGQRRTRAPRVSRRIVFVMIRPGDAAHRTADRVQLAVERDHGYLAAHRRKRRFHGPGSGGR